MNRRKLFLLLCIVCLVGTLAACSKSSGEKTNAETTVQPSAENAVPSDSKDKKYTITYFDGTWHNPVLPMDGKGVQMINEKFNIDFRPEFISYSEYSQKLPVKMAAGDIPDMIGMEGPDSNYYKWAKQGAFLPIDDLISKYKSLQVVPQYVYDAMRVDGKVYAIPRYFPVKYGIVPIIRKDWLDNLGLNMPTNYEELKQVAIAFTKNDPDQNGKNDTYGVGIAKNITFDMAIGAYWSDAWYHKNEEGKIIPGIISDGSKERIQFLADLYQAGAISKDWAISKIQDVQKDFYSGKFGIFFDQSYDMWDKNFKVLESIDPKAQLVTIPPFKAPDGTQGYKGGQGYYQMHILSSKLKDDPGKVAKIMEMEELFRTFVPVDERNPKNELFDWRTGHEGVGYQMVNGRPTDTQDGPKNQPEEYFDNRYYAPNDEANEVAKLATDPLQGAVFNDMEKVWNQYKTYINPINRIISPKYMEKFSELNQWVLDEQSKMIVGQSSISEWDKMVKTFMDKGGKEVVDEVNDKFQAAGIQGEWK